MRFKIKRGFIDCRNINAKLDLYRPKATKKNKFIGLSIIAYALLPLFSLWALPIGLFVYGSSIDVLLLLKNKLKAKGLYTL